MSDLIFKDECYAIVGAAMEVYNQLGTGFLEAVYQEALELELTTQNTPFKAQMPVTIQYKGVALKQQYIPDFLAYDAIIIEIKAIQELGPIQEAQAMNYLKATGFELGLLLNFGSAGKLQWKRIARSRRKR